MSRVVLTVVGSGGDLFPFIGVAHELQRRGHQVAFAAPPSLRHSIRWERFTWHPITGPSSSDDLRRVGARMLRPNRTQYSGIVPFIRDAVLVHHRENLREITALAAAADAVLTHPFLRAGAEGAEAAGRPALCLSMFPSLLAPEVVAQWQGPNGRDAQREAALQRAALRALGGFSACGSAGATLVLSDPAYTPPTPRLPSNVDLVGFSSWDTPRAWRPMPDLEELVADASGELVVICPGTSVPNLGSTRLAPVAASACAALGIRHVVLGERIAGADRRERAGLGYVPLSHVLPHARLLVHHGGIGTTAAALRSGVGAVVVPAMGDQHFHAERAVRLGAATAVPLERLSESILVDAIGAQLAKEPPTIALLDHGHGAAGRVVDALEADLAGATLLHAPSRALP